MKERAQELKGTQAATSRTRRSRSEVAQVLRRGGSTGQPSERAQATYHHLGDLGIAAPVFVETLVTDAHLTVESSRGDTREKALLPAGFALTIARRILDGRVGDRPAV
jgi:hypothetical protein